MENLLFLLIGVAGSSLALYVFEKHQHAKRRNRIVFELHKSIQNDHLVYKERRLQKMGNDEFLLENELVVLGYTPKTNKGDENLWFPVDDLDLLITIIRRGEKLFWRESPQTTRGLGNVQLMAFSLFGMVEIKHGSTGYFQITEILNKAQETSRLGEEG